MIEIQKGLKFNFEETQAIWHQDGINFTPLKAGLTYEVLSIGTDDVELATTDDEDTTVLVYADILSLEKTLNTERVTVYE